MKKVVVLVLLIAACSREKSAPPPAPQVRSTPPRPSAVVPKQTQPSATSSPATSYDEVINRFRIAPKFHFTFKDGNGSLTRPRQGMEQVRFHVTRGNDRGDWSADVKSSGVVWTKDGKRAASAPVSLLMLYQRLTIFPDPQKKEGAAQKNGDAYEFTNANGGERYVIQVDAGGNIRQMKIGDETIGITPG